MHRVLGLGLCEGLGIHRPSGHRSREDEKRRHGDEEDASLVARRGVGRA